nr:leucine-rich repeat-containing protein 56 [Leptinotarsa decemlineata]
MSPNLEGPVPEDEPEEEISIFLTPISNHSSSSSEVNFTEDAIQEGEIDVILLPEETVHIPLEQNLRELLVKVTNTEDLSTVTHIKLRVISREVTLQHLSIYTPALRELILDGSMVTSLRDIGGGLKNLKILRVNHCGLTCIDGVFGIDTLEELYAADNSITNLAPCAFLANIRIVDVRRNFISETNLGYLSLCQNLEELSVEGNPEIGSRYREKILLLLPYLKKIDGECTRRASHPDSDIHHNLATEQNRSGFSIQFPPRVFF